MNLEIKNALNTAYKQAAAEWVANPKSNGGETIDPCGIDRVFDKFALLIVRRCAAIYTKIDNGNSHLGTDNYLEALYRQFEVADKQD